MFEFLAMDGDAPLDGGMELIEGIACMLDGSLFAFHANPTITRCGPHFEVSLQLVQELGITSVNSLRGAGVFEFQREGFHRELLVGVNQRPARALFRRFVNGYNGVVGAGARWFHAHCGEASRAGGLDIDEVAFGVVDIY